MQGYKYCFLKLGFLNGTGPAAEGKAVGPSLKLEVDLRRKSLEHAMHPARGRRILRASPSAAGPITVTDKEGKAFPGEFEVCWKCICACEVHYDSA